MSKNTITLGRVVAMAALTLSGSVFAAGQQGMQVVRDAVTGELRAPNAEEAKALQPQAAQSKGTLRAAPEQSISSIVGKPVRQGVTAYEVPESSTVYSVVTRNADGSLNQQCITGADAADVATKNPAAVHMHKERQNEVN